MSRRDIGLLLDDMIEAAEKIKRYVSGLNSEAFFNDDKTIDAVVRNFEIIGEAASRIDEAFRDENSQIDWRRIRGFRNRLVHEYFGIDLSIMWSIIENDLDALIQALKELRPTT